MPSDLKEKSLELFRKIDVDGSKSIDREETLKFWGTKFAQLNANELFSSVDKNNDGSIQEDEWVEFWYNVYKAGHSKDEIIFEINNILNGGTWVKYGDVDDLNTKNKLKKKGKY
jgi:Ca2+-binding EF-hand superfamily protein